VDPVTDPLLFFVVPGIEAGTSGSVARNSDHNYNVIKALLPFVPSLSRF
jgi:hypothetical protein